MKLITMFTGRNAWKGAVYDRTENERNADNPLAWMLESELYKRENPSGSHACNGCKMKRIFTRYADSSQEKKLHIGIRSYMK